MMPAWRNANECLRDVFGGRPALVTGGLGFIGSNLAHVLVDCGAQVTIVDSLAERCGGSLENVRSLHGKIVVELSDLRRPHALPPLVHGKDFIFHLAGQAGHSASMCHPLHDLEMNCRATVNLAEACRRFNPDARLVFASTRQVYGRTAATAVNEDHPTRPIDVNGIHKLAAEQYLLVYHRVYGIRATVLRLTNAYGPRQKLGDAQLGVTSLFLHQALTGQTIRLYDGNQFRDFNHVHDVTKAFLLAAAHDECCGGVFNLGAMRPNTLAEFAQILQRLCHCDIMVVPFPQPSRAIEIGDYHADYSRFQKAAGWSPRISLEEGLAQTVNCYRRQSRYRSVDDPVSAGQAPHLQVSAADAGGKPHE